MNSWLVTAFYKFVDLPDPAALKNIIEPAGQRLGIIGTILLAPEGINSTIAGTPENLENFMRELRALEPFGDLEEKRSHAEGPPFHRFKVRLKKEIVTIGIPTADPRKAVGEYVSPEDWDDLIADPHTLLIDTRNDYEVSIGKFHGAVNPQTASFREFPKWAEKNLRADKDRKIAMYCTGGIRCEKATSLMLQMGYEKVYHLKGGILKYLERVPPDQSSWEGSCFVFDGRVGLEHGLSESDYDLCHGCRNPLSPSDREDPRYERGVCCPHCADQLTEIQKTRFSERQKQIDLAHSRGREHLGPTPANPGEGDEPKR